MGLGRDHVSLLKMDGTFWAWGDNTAYQLGNVNKTTTDNYSPIMSGNRSIGYFDLDVDLQEDGASMTDPVTDVSDEVNGVTFGGNGITASDSNPSGWRYRINENQQLRLNAQSYVVVSGTRSAINTSFEGAEAGSEAAAIDGHLKSYVTVAIMDETIAVLSQETDGTWLIRPAGRAEYGATAVVFKVYKATTDILGREYLDEDGNYIYQCVGESVLQLEVYPAGGIAVPMVVSGANHTLALKADGTVWAWGSNIYGQLGIANAGAYNFSGGSGVNRWLRDSSTDSCRVLGYHTYYGKYYTRAYDLMGNNILTSYATPQKVMGVGNNAGNGGSGTLMNIVQIAAGEYTSYALDANGQVYAWGYNNHGELGNGTYNYMYSYVYRCCHHLRQYSYGSGYYHSNCHLLWDVATFDQNAYSPVRVNNLSDATQISAGRDFAVALRKNGTVAYWGNSGTYQPLEYVYADFTTNFHINTSTGAADTVRRFESGMRAGDGVPGVETSDSINNRGCGIGNFTYHNQEGIFKTSPVTVLGPGGTGYLGDNTLSANWTTSQFSAQANSGLTAANNTPRVTKLVTGDEFVVALMSDGTVYTWGYQGDATTTSTARDAGSNLPASDKTRTLDRDGMGGTMGDDTSLSRIYPVQVKAGEPVSYTHLTLPTILLV